MKCGRFKETATAGGREEAGWPPDGARPRCRRSFSGVRQKLRLLGWGAALCLLLLVRAEAAEPPAAAAEVRHRQAVELARTGRAEAALEILRPLHEADPQNPRITYDYLVVLGWAGRDAEAVQLAPVISADEAPAYVLEALGKSFRNLGRFREAEEIYRRGAARFPSHLAFGVGLGLTRVDAGQAESAVAGLERLEREYPGNPDILLALAYAHEARRNHVEALHCYQRVLNMVPGNREALRRQILSLEALGAPFLAAELADRDPGLLSAEERLRLQGSRAALAVRWGDLPPPSESERFADTDRALRLLDETLQGLDYSLPTARAYEHRARADRLVALRDRWRMQEVVEEYGRLRQEGAAIPYTSLGAVGDAFLYLERPEEARDVYLQALEQQPGDFNTLLSLVYVYVELEDFDRAITLADHLNRTRPIWLSADGKAAPKPNPEKLQAELAAVLSRAYANDLDEASSQLEALHGAAPNNAQISADLGNVYGDRGWPRRARETYELGLALDRQHRGLQIGLAQSYLDLGEYRLAEQAIERLARIYPEDKAVQRLQWLWQVHNMRELVVEVGHGESSGTEFGSRETIVGATLYSRPWRYNWRSYLSAYYHLADFPEGTENYRRFGVGLEYRQRNLEADAELTFNQDGGDEFGGRLAATWRPDDRWAFPASVEKFSRETPLRALENGTTADAATIGAVYRASELFQAGLSLQAMDFSDGNFRYVVAGDLTRRVFTRPHFRTDLRLDLSTSENSETDVPYFSPDQDFSAAVTGDFLHLLWRRYSRSFSHRLALTLGNYWQDGYDDDYIAGALYEQTWETDYRFLLSYGFSRSRRVFDGGPDYLSFYFARLNWRF